MSKYVPKFKEKPCDEDKYINILLLGETGTGKSTFINSFVNYLQYSSLIDAEGQKLVCLIPTKFSVHTDDGDTKVLNFMNDDNEDQEIGNSSTQGAKAYVFPFESKMIRLIDTPGINDARGAITKDRENFENILEYIGQFKHLHAVCFLLKPDVTVLTASFKYCLIELFSRLDRSAATNISFIFTRTSSTDYKAPDTINCLRRVVDEIAGTECVTIPLRFKGTEQKNCFYFDNEGFKYLVARNQGVRVGNPKRLQESWDVSYASSWALINYIVGDDKHAPLPPHNVQDTVSVNKARLLIFELAKPLADITELIQDNLDVLKAHQAKIVQENLTSDELKQMMYVPTIDLEEKLLTQPVTVCAAKKCAETYTVSGLQKYHYKQRCHNPCYLTGVQKDVIGDAGLVHCAAMGGSTKCKQCDCHFTTHMHVYYETTTVESRIEDKTVQSQLATNAQIIKAQYDHIRKLENRVKEYKGEHQEISKALATFAYFLRNNSICPINDAYEAYLDCLIQREKIAFGSNKQLLQRYESLKKEHLEQKRLLEEAGKMAKAQKIAHVTSDQIMAIWECLKKLPHTGRKINTLHRMLTERKHGEMLKNMEYVHTQIARVPKKPEPPVQPASTGAKKKKKGKANPNGLEEKKSRIADLLASDDMEGAMALMIEYKEEEERQKLKESEQQDKMEAMMKMFEAMFEAQIAKKKENTGKNTSKENTESTNFGHKGSNKAQGNQNQNRGGTHPNRGGNIQNRGGNNQGRGGYNQGRGGYNQGRGGYNQGTGNYHAQAKTVYPSTQPNETFHQYHNNQQQYPNYQQQYPNPQFQNLPPQQYAHNYNRPGPNMELPLQFNINLNSPEPKIEPLLSRYREPPPAYSNVLNDNSHVRGKPQQQQPPKQRNAQFKKQSPRKHVPNSVANTEEDDKEVEDEEDSNDEASINNMRRYLDEQRKKLNQEPSLPARAAREAEARASDNRPKDNDVTDRFMKFFNSFKKN